MEDHDDQTKQLAPGWWKTKAGWKAAGNRPATESGWLLLPFGIAFAVVLLLFGGWGMWSAAALSILMSSVGLLPKRVAIGLWIVLILVIIVVPFQPMS